MAAAGAGLVITACGSASAKIQAATPSASASTPASSASASAPTTESEPLAPLTGLPTQSSAAARPAVALMVAGADPQGLSDADVIYEEVTSPLRYMAVFQSRQAAVVGPITSTRPADGQALAVLKPLTGYDGGTAPFIQVLDHTGVVDLGYGTHSSLYQDGADGVTTSTSAFWAAATSSAPPGLFPYRGSATSSQTLASTGESRPASVTVQLPGYGTQEWAFDAHTDLWQQVAGGPPISVANLIIQTVGYKELFLSHRYGLTVPGAEVTGRGSFEAFTGIGNSDARGPGGLAASGDWSKPGYRSVTDYDDAAGYPMYFQPGPTWVILAPAGTLIQAAEAKS